MRDYLVTLFWWTSSLNYLWYPIEMTSHSNIENTRSRPIDNMMFPNIWLAQNNITNIKRGNIKHYLILEGLDSIGHATLVHDRNILSLVKPPDVVWLWVWCCQQPQLFDDLS